MEPGVAANESDKPVAGLAYQAIACMCCKLSAVSYDARWSSHRICGGRLASARAGTAGAGSAALGVGNGATPETAVAELAGNCALPGTLGAAVCTALDEGVDTCSGKVNVKRTGELISSASMASRCATETNTYPDASVDPTLNGCAGFPSTAISATPRPTLLAMTPDKTNLSAGPGPGPACGNGAAPRSRANAAVLVVSGGIGKGAAYALSNTRAEMPACVQYQPETTTDAHTRVVALRQPRVLFNLNIENRSSHGVVFARKTFRCKLSRCPTAHRGPDKKQRGFTLIELMVVLVIIGVLAALIVPNVLDRADDARVMAARTDVNNLNQALKLYKLDNQRLPTTEQGLQALVGKPTAAPVPASWKAYLDKLPNDPWGRPYQYMNPGVKGEVDVMSLGADGQPGGEGRNADVGSWQ